jgi:sarcosine oxidase
MPNAGSADVLIVGLGAVGSAALRHAAQLKARVIGIDRFSPPHNQGSSHGDTRITRQAIGEGREYVPLALRSNEIWEELEAATGRSLLTRCGCLILSSPGVPGHHHGSTSFLQDTIDAAREFRIDHEILRAADVQRRYPQFRLRGDELGYFEPGAGFLRPEACIQAQLDVARRAGAQILTDEVVSQIDPIGSEAVEIRTNRGTYSAGRVIVTAGAWIAKLLGDEHASLFKIYPQTMCWFALGGNAERYAPGQFPVFIWIAGNEPRDMLYGFPAIDGPNGGIKVAGEQYEGTVDPDQFSRSAADSDVAAIYRDYLEPRFPDLSGDCLRTSTCLYTVTPDAGFIIDRFRNYQNVWFASACSGHGFKHSAAIGEALADQASGRQTKVEVLGFGMERFRKSGI